MRKPLYVGVLMIGLLAAGCGTTGGKSETKPITADQVNAAPTPTATAMEMAGARIGQAKTKLGAVLVGRKERTLYLFEKDKGGKSSCAGACARAWPPFITKGKPEAGEGIKSELLGTVERGDGKLQVTYNNHPLYYFIKDKKAGDTLGNDVKAFGAEWYAVSLSGEKAH
ncbi:hypothetical protein [Streptosporangium sp. NPDC000396]|uniref:COG4315 family predicted lipoprotein n=1 Tax=Streptosporangium sp. NPDC000396 TaxID=3366185 RepID=UPI0036AFD9B9